MTTEDRRSFLKKSLGALALASSALPLRAADSPDGLVVMTYNLRFAGPRPPNAWSDRRPIMRDCIKQIAPDVFGTQEGVYYQLRELASDLPDYDWIGLGRDGGSKGEFMAVYFRKSRLEPLEYDHFWLSDTPEVIASTTWGNTNRRMVTWVRFRDLKTKREFYFFNTHFDHRIQDAREKSADLVLKRIDALKTALPVLLVGDFNAVAGRNKAYSALVKPEAFTDAWIASPTRRNEGIATFNGFMQIYHTGDRIDWILYRGDVKVNAMETVTFSRNNQFPSDHFPVVAWLELAAKP